MSPAQTAASLGLAVLQRDWLSANHVLFPACGAVPSTVVDTGYCRHAPLTLQRLEEALGGAELGRIVNTHLHSDHCGGNAALQARYPRVQTWVPAASLEAVQCWDESRLSYRPSGQDCPRFRAEGGLAPGQALSLGPACWQVVAAPGHDDDAVMLFEPQTRTLIAGDALWEHRLAVLFPVLDGRPGFVTARFTLDCIEALAPRWVIPGHGAPFEDVERALATSRSRLSAFEADPVRHARHAARALLMFHLLERDGAPESELHGWLLRTPVFDAMARQCGAGDRAGWAGSLLRQLVDDGLAQRRGDRLEPADPS